MAQATRAIKRNACAMSKEDFNVNSFLRDQHLSREETIVLSKYKHGYRAQRATTPLLIEREHISVHALCRLLLKHRLRVEMKPSTKVRPVIANAR
jgi:hypothetical protein